MSRVYFAVGRCQHGAGGCQEARMFGQRATIVSPDFDTPQALEAWLARKAASPADRRCRNCKRPIGIQNFERRQIEDDGTVVIVHEALA